MDRGITVSPELIERFLVHLQDSGRTKGTQSVYRRRLEQMYALLGEDKTIGAGTLLDLREKLLETGAANSTVNTFTAAANTLLEYCDRRDFQVVKPLEADRPLPPELTRAEYLRLLSAAKTMEKERAYMITKVFAGTGLYVRELPEVTVEAVTRGRVDAPSSGTVHITDCLCRELLEYAGRLGIKKGPIFVTSTGKTLLRGPINAEIRQLAQTARVSPEKCNPLALRRLYLATQEGIRASLALLMEQTYDRLIEKEQQVIGWERPAVQRAYG